MNRDHSDLVLIYLAACAVHKRKADPALIAKADPAQLFRLAVFHQLASLVSGVLAQAGSELPGFKTERAKAVFLETTYDRERSVVLDSLEKAGIWYMPLKGIIMKEYYPQAGMRQMSDNDILIDASRAQDVSRIMESLGFEVNRFGEEHRDDYRKPPLLHFEMHRCLFEPDFPGELFADYFDHIKERLVSDGRSRYGYRFTNEDFYIYMIAHEYKHIAWGGTGLRALLDVYVFLDRFADELDWEYINEQTRKLEITDYEKKNRELALKVFTKGSVRSLDEKERDMLSYFVTSGVHGTVDHSIQNNARNLGISRYVLSRIFLPLSQVEESYPFFYRHKLLLPLLPLYRLIRHAKDAVREIRSLIR